MEPYREGEILFGTGMDNMKSGLAAVMGAVVAWHRSSLRLGGDVIVAGVCGEIGLAPVDQYQGRHYRSKGSVPAISSPTGSSRTSPWWRTRPTSG